MNKEEITTEDVLNVTGSIFETMLDYVDNSSKDIEQLQQENQQLKTQVSAREEVANKYKEVIEEVREEVKKSSLEVNTREYGMLTVCNSDDLLQILDKGVDK